ncbi:MAG: recombinase family protein [Gemmatimonadetes bacterium]|nr:recombinase family protein [Gemmatimonadota bacterium]
MTATLVGYARCSTDGPALAGQCQALLEVGVANEPICIHFHTDQGLTGMARGRLGLDQVLGTVRSGDTLVVMRLDQLARSVPDAPGSRRSGGNDVLQS